MSRPLGPELQALFDEGVLGELMKLSNGRKTRHDLYILDHLFPEMECPPCLLVHDVGASLEEFSYTEGTCLVIDGIYTQAQAAEWIRARMK